MQKLVDMMDGDVDEQKFTGFSLELVGGKHDGERFDLTQFTKPNGEKVTAFKSNARPGLFKQVMVPLEFQHPAIVDD